MPGRIVVINPNSLAVVTAGIDKALSPFRIAGGPEITCLTLTEGPPGIQSQRDVDAVVNPLLRLASAHENKTSAFVIACFSDPGLFALREQSALPVQGIAESGVLTALTMGQRFGVVSILPSSIPRHLRYFGAMGVIDRLAADLAIGLTVSELADDERTLSRMVEVGLQLRDGHGADVLVMGCAGMARFQEALMARTGLPVVEPTLAATGMALARVLQLSRIASPSGPL